MKTSALLMLFLCAGWALIGCSTGGSSSTGSDNDAASVSLNDGPRAAEQPVDAALATQGEELFQAKGCTACHAFGQQLSGPDLSGVTTRRTSEWLETQILRPDEMAKSDPIARELIAKHALQMPNQGLTGDEAKAVIEFLKSHDAMAGSSQ